MNIPSDTLKTLLSALIGKSPSPAAEALAPDPASALMPGREITAEVLERQQNGRYLVRAGGELFDMPLPGKLRPGTTIPLTYLGDTPRPTFSLSSPASKGSDVSLSSAGKWLGTLAADVAQKDTPAAVQTARPPLISGDLPLDRPLIAARLREAIGRSGLFYESHVARWREGGYSLAELLEEPQAQESPLLKGAVTTESLPAGETAPQDKPPATFPAKGVSPPPEQTGRQHQTARPAAYGQAAMTTGTSMEETARGTGQLSLHDRSETAGSPETPEPSSAAGTLQEPALPATTQPSRSDQPHRTSAAVSGTVDAEPPLQNAVQKPPVEGETAPDQQNRTGRGNITYPEAPATKSAVQSQPLPLSPMPLPGDDAEAIRRAIPEQTASREETAHPRPVHQPLLQGQPDSLQGKARPLAYGEPPSTPLPDRSPREALVVPLDKAASPSFEPPPPQTLPVIRQQLEFLQSGQILWQGEAWNGQPFEWKIGREDRKRGEAPGNSWETSLNLDLPKLGRISARLQLTGGDVRVSVVTAEEPSARIMEKEKQKLVEGMEAAGLRLTGMEVRRVPSS